MFKRILISAVVILFLIVATYIMTMFPVISAAGAKFLCSCVYVSGRDVESVNEEELGGLFVNWGTYEVNRKDFSATGSVLGGWKKKAIWRPGYGCTLVNGLTEEELRNQNLPPVPEEAYLNAYPGALDTIPWPSGNFIKDTLIPGVNYELLDKAIDNALSEPDPDDPRRTRAVLVVYKGHLIAEMYGARFSPYQRQMGWSMAKSVTNALTGVLVQKGKLDINDRAPVSAWEDPEDERHNITLDQLLRMSSGLNWNESYFTVSTATNMLFKLPDAGGFAAEQDLDDDPDSTWYYSSGTSNILSKIIREQVDPEEYYNFPRKELFYKIGMYSMTLEPDPNGTFVGSSFAWATPRDWARFGLLYLNDGVWAGERILPEGWVEYSSTPTPKSPRGMYGAQFWLNAGSPGNPDDRSFPDVPVDAYYANGFDGQIVFIIPSKDLVVVRLGLTQGSNFSFNDFVGDVVRAVE